MWQVAHRADSNGAKSLHTGQANARTGFIVSRCNCFWSDMRFPFAANPGRARTPTCPRKVSSRPIGYPTRWRASRSLGWSAAHSGGRCRRRSRLPTPWALTVEIDERLAEYDRDMEHYIPIEQIAAEFPEELARLAQGHLPSSVDEAAFLARIDAGIRDLVAAGDHEDTVAVFSHGGVINGLLHSILGTEKILSFNVDYAGITRLLSSREGNLYVAAVNGTEHVWDLLPRNQR